MTRVARLLGAGHKCSTFIVNKWENEEGQRPCRFPALWRFGGKNYCTRHGGLQILNQLADETDDARHEKFTSI